MKSSIKSLFLAGMAVAVACVGCKNKSSQAVAEEVQSSTPKEVLAARLASMASSGKVAFGQHDAVAYGHDWRGEADRSDVKEVVGDLPAVLNWDLGLVEVDSVNELDGVPFEFIRNEAVKHNAAGGINTFSWHVLNPATRGNSWDVKSGDVVTEVVTEGTALNDSMKVWMGKAADFLLTLKDADGELIPIVFRPWHEHTGGWFWWGVPNTNPESYKKLWAMTRKVFDEKGLGDNVLWAYSPDKIADEAEFFQAYPGDDYVDIIGTDVYAFDGEGGIDLYRERVDRNLSIATKYAQKTGKLAAFTETGMEGVVVPDWYTRVLLPLLQKYPVSYVTVWRNAPQNENPGHFYVPFKGHPAEESFKAFFANDSILFLNDIKK